MKKMKIEILILFIALTSGISYATSINFANDFNEGVYIVNVNGVTTFNFDPAIITGLMPYTNDPVINTSVHIAQLTVGSKVALNTYILFPSLIKGGFKIYAPGSDGIRDTEDDILIMNADLAVGKLFIRGSTAIISAEVDLSLRNITVNPAFNSSVLNEFIAPSVPGGDIVITLQVAGTQSSIKKVIETSNTSLKTSYSGSIAPLPPVAEPGTIILIGSGIVGVIGVIKRKKR